MNLSVIGSGYVGLVSGACFADFGLRVICVDSNPDRVEELRAGRIPFYEPGLEALVARNVERGRLEFTTDIERAVRDSLVLFLAVGTPQADNGEADLSQILDATAQIAVHMDGYRVVVTKSTVPAGTGALVADVLRRAAPPPATFDVVSNPEFLREGSAIDDFMRPDRIVIGTSSAQAAAIMKDIYRPLFLIETPIVFTSVESAEVIKYASNAFLAVKIGFMNEIANLCDQIGADVHAVAKGMGLDRRIGPKFLHSGPGYGGSCFPKDTRALAAMGRASETRQTIVEAAIDANDRQQRLALEKIRGAVGTLQDVDIAVLGLSFKPNTSDVREAPALFICRELAAAGARVRAYDPVAMSEARSDLAAFDSRITYFADAYEAAEGAGAVVVMTEWNEFRAIDLARLRSLVVPPAALLDMRNIFDPAAACGAGFRYCSTGRQATARQTSPLSSQPSVQA